LREWRTSLSRTRARAAEASANIHLPGLEVLQNPRAGFFARIALLAALVLFVLYPFVAWLYSGIDDDPKFSASAASWRPGMSHSVAAVAALVDLEVNRHEWTPNDPWFWPTALLDDKPNYQMGMVAALANFSNVLSDRLGRAGANAPGDADLQDARDALHYPPDIWLWKPQISLWAGSTESRYRGAIESLSAYNERLATGQAVFTASADNLRQVLEHIAADFDSSAAQIESHVRHSGFAVSVSADDIFYSTKGKAYAYYIVLKEIQPDFEIVIRDRNLGKRWSEMLTSLRALVTMRPSIVFDGSADGSFLPCHLCGEGFFLLRTREQLRDMAAGLQS
jgi:hypothetical protein